MDVHVGTMTKGTLHYKDSIRCIGYLELKFDNCHKLAGVNQFS